VPWRPTPVEGEGQWLPSRLRPKLFLPDIMRPAAAGLTNAAAHHQHVDDAAIVHVHVVPVVHCGTDDDHGLALGPLRVLGKFAGDMDDLIGGNARDLRRPGRSTRNVVGIIIRYPLAAETAI